MCIYTHITHMQWLQQSLQYIYRYYTHVHSRWLKKFLLSIIHLYISCTHRYICRNFSTSCSINGLPTQQICILLENPNSEIG